MIGRLDARRWPAIPVGLVLAGLLPMSATANGPAHQTFRPAGLALSFTLPADWGKVRPDKGTRFQVIAPGRVAQLRIGTVRTTLTLSALAANIADFERQQVALADPSGSVATRVTQIRSISTVKLTLQYHGLSTRGEDDLREFIYIFVRNGVGYLFDYGTTARWIEKEQPIFEASIKSLHLALVA